MRRLVFSPAVHTEYQPLPWVAHVWWWYAEEGSTPVVHEEDAGILFKTKEEAEEWVSNRRKEVEDASQSIDN